MKKCFKCGQMLELEMFYMHPQMLDGRVNKCKECNKKDVRENYRNTIDEKKAYDVTRKTSVHRIFYMRYSNLVSRSTKLHITYGKRGSYGKPFLTKEEWFEWCYSEKNYKVFIELYNNWVQNNFDMKLSPSIDRIENTKGYVTENLQWLTKGKNSSKK